MENYFNYFTEVEECFRRQRGTPTFLSTLDWALIESWKDAGIPLQAVEAGIERSFQKFARRRRLTKINGLAFCVQEVMVAAEEVKRASVESGPGSASAGVALPPFPLAELVDFLGKCSAALKEAAERQHPADALKADLTEAAGDLNALAARDAARYLNDLEALERALTSLEEKVTASLTRGTPVHVLAGFHEEVDRSMVPYRRKLNALQIESLRRQFLKKRLFEHYQIPRLSLFYIL
jgi:hypothetical protein